MLTGVGVLFQARFTKDCHLHRVLKGSSTLMHGSQVWHLFSLVKMCKMSLNVVNHSLRVAIFAKQAPAGW